MESEMTQRERPNLRARLAQKRLLVAPGVFDGISAKIADQMDFEALYMTGYGTVASHRGIEDAADRRRRHRLWRSPQRSIHGARLRGGGRHRHPA
jgi:2-methylisocitrate lyase-like PEP mutase family enzyme